MRFVAPTQATLLAMILGLLGVGLGSALGSWVGIGTVAVYHGGWSMISRVGRKWILFPVIPDWLNPAELRIANWLTLALLLVGLTGGLILGLNLWRRLVVKTFEWMTDQEVDEFLRRDPGF